MCVYVHARTAVFPVKFALAPMKVCGCTTLALCHSSQSSGITCCIVVVARDVSRDTTASHTPCWSIAMVASIIGLSTGNPVKLELSDSVNGVAFGIGANPRFGPTFCFTTSSGGPQEIFR